MKLHSKLFLILLSCIVVFVSVAYILVIHLTQQQTEIEKLDMNYGVLKQTVMSFEYLSDSIERYIFDQCRAEGIASVTQQTDNPSILKIQLQSKIQVIGSSPYLLEGFIVDQSGGFFYQCRRRDGRSVPAIGGYGFLQRRRRRPNGARTTKDACI